jgi:hypothetical protein
MKLLLLIALLTALGSHSRAQAPDQYYRIRKELHDEIVRKYSLLDSMEYRLDSLNRVNQNIYADLQSVARELEAKLEEAYQLRQSLVENQVNYESTEARFQRLRKQYYKLKYDKPRKIIITRKKLILPSDERKILYVMASLAVIFAGTSIAVTQIMR